MDKIGRFRKIALVPSMAIAAECCQLTTVTTDKSRSIFTVYSKGDKF